MMKYSIKAYLIKDGTSLDNRFECLLTSFEDVVKFLSCVSLEAYDVVKVFPVDYTEV